jgi:hypothetical protein
MKLPSTHSITLHGQRAFTLVEALIASATLVIIVGSVIMCNLFGLSMAARQQIWLGCSDDAAQALSTLTTNIRSAVTLQVGSYTNSVFTPVAITNQQQSGNALMVYLTTNTTPWTLFYYDPVSNNLVQTNFYAAGSAGDCKLVSANPITNDSTHPIFTEVDYTGTPLSNGTPVASISVYLSFTKLQDPQVDIESGSIVDLYQITTIVSPRIRL